MLPPFRVRTLRPSASPGLGRSKSKEFNALVRITAPEYDKTLRVCPEASLKYLDEEDGEIVTVGSSFELIQCLETPSQQNPHYIGLIPRVSSLPSRRDFSEALLAPAAHQRIFHIESRPSSVQLWREIEERSKEIYITPLTYSTSNEPRIGGLFRNPYGVQLTPNLIPDPGPLNSQPSSSMSDMTRDIAPESDPQVHVDASDDLSRLQELEDYRITPLDASIRPNISQAQEAQSKNRLKNVVDVPFSPADRTPRLQELAGYGLKPHLRRDPPDTDGQPGSNLKPSPKESLLHDRDEPLVSQQQHEDHTWSRSAGARNDSFEFHAALAHAPENYGREANDKQSLLNLFEAELARAPSPSAHIQNEAWKGNVQVYDNVFSMGSALKSKAPLYRSTQLDNTNLEQTPQTPAQVCIHALDLGLGAALSSFHACMSDIAESVQQASAAVQSADRSRIESAMASFRSFAHELAASARVVELRLKSDTAKLDLGETITMPEKDNRCTEFLSRKVQNQVVEGEPVLMTTTREPKRSTTTEETASFKDVASSRRSKSALSSEHHPPFFGKAQDGTIVPTEDRIALRPSLNKSNMFFKQACDDSRDRNNPTYSISFPRTSIHNASESFMERAYSGEEPNKTTASHKVIIRFPNSKQSEVEGLVSANQFPPLPSMEALEPHRLNSQPRVTQRLITIDSMENNSDHEISNPEHIGSTSVTPISDKCESSGEFFNRMTGLGKESMATPRSSLQASVDQVTAGLDAGLAQDDSFHRRKNVTCRQTVSGPARYDNSVNNTRRPYSENFSGEGRIGWDTFLRQGSESFITNHGVEPIPSRTFERGHVLPSGVPSISSHNVQKNDAASEARHAEINQHIAQSNLNGPGDAAYVRKLQSCVTQLHSLGYGSNAAQGGLERLTVYAQAAEGDLIGAIDIIDEEQRAYKLGLPG